MINYRNLIIVIINELSLYNNIILSMNIINKIIIIIFFMRIIIIGQLGIN